MAWNLQQINGGSLTGSDDYAACPQSPPIASYSNPFVCTFGNQQHFVYADINHNLQDCWWDGDAGKWNLQQINGGTGPTVPKEHVACSQAPIAGQYDILFVCTFKNQQHFAYLDGNNNIQDCWWDGDGGEWKLQQINGGTGPTVPNEPVACPQAPSAFPQNRLFVSTFGNQQHFTYFDTKNNLQDCWWDGDAKNWNLQQINGGAGRTVPTEPVACPQAPAASAYGVLFVSTFKNQQHFVYLDDNDNCNLQDCWYDGDTGHWNLQQINGGIGPTVPGEYVACKQAPGATPWVSVCTFKNQQHFVYIDGKNNLQDCWYDGDAGNWKLQQINGGGSTVSGEYVACPQAIPAATGSTVSVCTYEDQQHFVYPDGDNYLQDCWYDGNKGTWNVQQINGGGRWIVWNEYVACQQAPAAATIVSVCTFGNQQHFAYLDNNNNLQDCWYEPSSAVTGLQMQYQEMSNWCWIAVATSVSHYYDPSSTWTQCSLITAQLQANTSLNMQGQCCPDPQLISSTSGLAAALEDPYSSTALGVLDSVNSQLAATPSLICNHSGDIWKALTQTGNLKNDTNGALTFSDLFNELSAGRPVCICIAWSGSNKSHYIAATGVEGSDTVIVADPANGPSVLPYQTLTSSYQGSGCWNSSYYTQS